jgi:mannose-6-phosphate isomerase-like protein (cupin superfamily)
MIENPIISLAKETSKYLGNISSETSLSSIEQTQLAFAKDIEAVHQKRLPEQWFKESEVRALRFAPKLIGNQGESKLKSLYTAARNAFGVVRWTEFYAEDNWSRSFLPHFANGEGIGKDGRLYNEEIILGLFIFGHNSHYPAHAHPAEEFYLILSGSAEWQIGTNTPYINKKPGDIMIHQKNESHSFQTGKEPLFCVYGWRGEINAKSWYRNDMGDKSEVPKYPTINKS